MRPLLQCLTGRYLLERQRLTGPEEDSEPEAFHRPVEHALHVAVGKGSFVFIRRPIILIHRSPPPVGQCTPENDILPHPEEDR